MQTIEMIDDGRIIPETADDLVALVHCFMDFGETLLLCGAEISRVEDTIMRLGQAYGALRTNIFAISSNITVTLQYPGNLEMTRTRRILTGCSTDFTKLEELNELSRRCCRNPIPAAVLHREVAKIREEKAPAAGFYAGSVLGAAAFALFFGGDLNDAAATAVAGLLIAWMQRKLTSLFPNSMAFHLTASLVSGVLICLFGKAARFHVDMITIGAIMLLIPGMAITNAVRDILVGDTLAGVLRIIECLLIAGSLACGFMFAMVLTGGI